jgi:NitT/TauT family transport system permease protein
MSQVTNDESSKCTDQGHEMKIFFQKFIQSFPFILSICIGIMIWHYSIIFFDMPSYVLPKPGLVWIALYDGLSQDPFARSSFWFHLSDTLNATLMGFVIGGLVGLVGAAMMAESKIIETALLPYVVGLQSLPKVAIAPLLVIWFGYGIESKVAMAFVLTLFPVLINSLSGFRSFPKERIELMISLKATRWNTFRLIKFPSAMPMVFSGLNIGIVYAMLGTLVSEFSGGQKGMGVIMMQMQAVSDTAGVFAAMAVLGFTGYVLISLMRQLQKYLVFWMEEVEQGLGV